MSSESPFSLDSDSMLKYQSQEDNAHGGGEPESFVAIKREVSPEANVLFTQGRSDEPITPDLRTVRYDPKLRIIGTVESGHPAHEAVHMSIVEQITLQMGQVPPTSRLVPLGSPSTSFKSNTLVSDECNTNPNGALQR